MKKNTNSGNILLENNNKMSVLSFCPREQAICFMKRQEIKDSRGFINIYAHLHHYFQTKWFILFTIHF